MQAGSEVYRVGKNTLHPPKYVCCDGVLLWYGSFLLSADVVGSCRSVR